MSLPRISIITPCLNRARFIREAVESVLNQGYPDFEHIIVDGGSTDGTLTVLEKYPHLRVISEPDKGMYDAINKGLHFARGAVIGLLNSDDLYAAGSLRTVAERFSHDASAQAVVGGAEVFLDEDGERRVIRSNPAIWPDEFWWRVVAGSPVSNAWFFRRRVFQEIGYFNDSYRYVADREFLIRVGLAGVRPLPLSQVLYRYRCHNDSATITALDSRLRERGLFRMRVLSEGVRMLESFLRGEKIPAEAQRYFRFAHSEQCYKLAATALYHRCWKEAMGAIKEGWRYDAGWPFVFIRLFLSRLREEWSFTVRSSSAST